MPIPTGYTETELIAYMNEILGRGVRSHFQFVDNADVIITGIYDEAFNSTMFAYGVADVTTISGMDNINLLRAYSRYFAWELVAFNAGNEIDYTHADSGATYKGSQYQMQAKMMMDRARGDIEAGGGDISGISVDMLSVEYSDDLYTATAVSDSGSEWSS